MKAKQELLGSVYGRLMVKGPAPRQGKAGNLAWWCVCSCGKEIIAAGTMLRCGNTMSCGCARVESLTERNYKHGASFRRSETPTYRSWKAMHTRCTNPNQPGWPNYGGRGIKVCARWGDFNNFLADMGERPDDKTLDRYPDPDGDYEPANCRWATSKEQAANKRPRG